MSQPPRRPGRPRDTSIDERVLDATRELLVEVGFGATSVQAIAARSGVHASAIYRRWRSRTEIVEEVVFPGFTSLCGEVSGDLHEDLRRFIGDYVDTLAAPAAVAAIPGLLASYQATGTGRSPEEWLPVSARPQFRAIVEAAEGKVDPCVDIDDVFDALLGAILVRIVVPTITARRRPVDALVDLTIRLLEPRGR